MDQGRVNSPSGLHQSSRPTTTQKRHAHGLVHLLLVRANLVQPVRDILTQCLWMSSEKRPLQGLVFLRWCRRRFFSRSWQRRLAQEWRAHTPSSIFSSSRWRELFGLLVLEEITRARLIFSQLTLSVWASPFVASSPCNSPKTFADHAFKPCRTSLR